MFLIILILAVILIAGFFPGFCLLNILAPSKLRREEIIAASFGVSFLILGISSFVVFILNIQEARFFNCSILFFLLVFCLYYFVYYRPRRLRNCSPEDCRIRKSYKYALIIFCLYLLNIFAFQCILPIYAGGGWYIDWLNHYKVTLFFSGDIGFEKIVLERTPLYSLIQVFFLSVFSNSFWEFQLVNVLLGSLFVVSTYLLAEKVFGPKIGLISLGVIFLNPWCIHLSWFTWPKMCVVYFVMLSLYFYLCLWQDNIEKGRKKFLIFFVGLFAGLGFLIHPFALFYTTAIFLDLLFFRGRFMSLRQRLKILLSLLLFILILNLPWYIYTIYTYGFRDAIFSSPVFSFQAYQSKTLFNFVVSRFHNSIFSIIPFHILITLLWKQFIGAINIGYIINALTEFYFNPLMGCLTFTGTFTFILVFIRHLFREKTDNTALSKYTIKEQYLFLIPALLCGLILFYILVIFLNNRPCFENIFVFYPRKVFLFLCLTAICLMTGGFIISYICSKRKLAFSLNNNHLMIGLLMVVSYIFAVIAHPGVDWHGVMHNTMIPAAVIIIMYLCKIISNMKFPFRVCIFLGFILEMCLGIWMHLFMLLKGGVFRADPNWVLKANFKIIYLSDILTKNTHLFFIYFAICIEVIGIGLLAICLFNRPHSICNSIDS